ncbi:MAG: penicillin-binding protein [Candidatus Berkelbacteria bacterium]|nr:penicillin-binding protein [Candidatus Berkelbacteria bacterium]
MKLFSRLFSKWKRHIDDINPLHGKIKKNRHIWRKILIWSGYSLLGLILVIAGMFAWFSKDLPTPQKIADSKPTESTKIYDRTGTILLYETGEQKRTIITSDQISPYLKEATVAVEDANFYNHHGIQITSILSAVKDKLLGHTAVLRGGSTITQQYVKNSLLTSDRSIGRKIKEAILSVELEFMYNKDQILTMYLNEIPYGNATAGAEAASKLYYGVSAKDLSLAQAATLAAIPQAPTTYSPYGTHVDKLITRRNHVLDRMVETGKISKEDADKAKTVDTTTVGAVIKPKHDSIVAPHFAMYVLEQIADEYGEDMVQKQGLKIITTLDFPKQQAAEQAITDGAAKNTKYGASNAALVSVDPKTGQILAMVGSKDYWDTSIDGNVNVAAAPRQPGSSFKPIAYATAFKSKDFSPSKVLYDFTTDFGGGYIPHNYTGKSYGPVTIRQALTNSLNVPAVKIMSLAGIDEVLQTASDLGIDTLTQRDRYGLSLVLGAGEVPPVEMAGAFSVFATGGVKHTVTPILKISDASNKTLFEWTADKADAKPVLDPQIAYEISNILSDNNARSLVFGTRTALYFPNRTVAVKTGTTSDFKDAWTVGYTPSLATAIWVGNSDGTVMKSGADGSVLAAPIFHQYVEKALTGVPDEPFTQPDGITSVTVEKYSNKLPTQYSKEKTTDIFASWQVPTENDDVNTAVRLCKGTNLVAPDSLPDPLVTLQVYTNVHSERPTNPNWENSVHDWAVANGLSSAIPTAKCDTSALTFSINFTSPSNNDTLSGSTNLAVAISNSNSINKVEYFLNSVSIGSATSSPWSLEYNFGNIDPGSYKLSAIATDTNGVTANAEISVTIKVKGVTISGIIIDASDTVHLTATMQWQTSEQTLDTVTYHLDGGSDMTASSSDSLTTTHKANLLNILPGKKYYYTISSKSSNGATATSSGTFDSNH